MAMKRAISLSDDLPCDVPTPEVTGLRIYADGAWRDADEQAWAAANVRSWSYLPVPTTAKPQIVQTADGHTVYVYREKPDPREYDNEDSFTWAMLRWQEGRW